MADQNRSADRPQSSSRQGQDSNGALERLSDRDNLDRTQRGSEQNLRDRDIWIGRDQEGSSTRRPGEESSSQRERMEGQQGNQGDDYLGETESDRDEFEGSSNRGSREGESRDSDRRFSRENEQSRGQSEEEFGSDRSSRDQSRNRPN